MEKGVTLIAGDSMINGLKENKLSKFKNVKVRCFSGAKIADMMDYVKPLLKKAPDTIIIHCGTNDSINYTSREILDDILMLKSFVESQLSRCKVIISTVIKRIDNGKAQLTLSRLNNQLKELNIDLIENDNIDANCLSGDGLHLSALGTGKLAINFINKMRSVRAN
jgi:lysophospholipase L1-like esterase